MHRYNKEALFGFVTERLKDRERTGGAQRNMRGSTKKRELQVLCRCMGIIRRHYLD